MPKIPFTYAPYIIHIIFYWDKLHVFNSFLLIHFVFQEHPMGSRDIRHQVVLLNKGLIQASSLQALTHIQASALQALTHIQGIPGLLSHLPQVDTQVDTLVDVSLHQDLMDTMAIMVSMDNVLLASLPHHMEDIIIRNTKRISTMGMGMGTGMDTER